MGLIKSRTKRTRQQRLAGTNRRLAVILNACERIVGKFEKALLEYANGSNWASNPDHPNIPEWLGPGNGPSLAQACFKPPIGVPDSGSTEVKTNE